MGYTMSMKWLRVALAALAVSGCSLFPHTEIVREVQAIWAGSDLLVAESSYWTRRPNQPYFAAAASRDWSYRLLIWPDGNESGAIEIAELPEETFTAGGSIEYSRMHWNSDTNVISVSDWNGPYLLVSPSGAPGTWDRVSLSAPESLRQLLDFPAPVNDLSPNDVALSPDGSAVAILWHFAYSTDVGGLDLRFNEIAAFYDARDGSFLYARRLNEDPGGSTAAQFGPHPTAELFPSNLPFPFISDAANFSRIIWAHDSSGIYLVDTAFDAAVFVGFDAGADAAFTSAPQPVAATNVPASALPSNSGPVRDDGRAAIVTLIGNEGVLSFTQLSGWTPFGGDTLVPIGDAEY